MQHKASTAFGPVASTAAGLLSTTIAYAILKQLYQSMHDLHDACQCSRRPVRPALLLRQQGCSYHEFCLFEISACSSSMLLRKLYGCYSTLMARLQRSRGRCLTIVNMKKDIHPKYYEEAKVIRAVR